MNERHAEIVDLNDPKKLRWFLRQLTAAAKKGLIRGGGECSQECEDVCSSHGGCALCTPMAAICNDDTVVKLAG